MITIGKENIVRRTGKDLEELRDECYERDGGKCVKCGRRLVHSPDSILQPDAYHMSHKRNKRMWGDTISNVESLCTHDHLVGVHNPKSVPKK